MGQPSSKVEEKLVIQSAPGGVNSAKVEEYHLSTTNVLLMIIVLAIFLTLLGTAYKIYKKCHISWINREISGSMLRRSLRVRYRPEATPKLYPDAVGV